MKAVVFEEPGDESVLRVDEVPSPEIGEGEVLIRVAAAGVNRADLLQRRGLYPPPPGASSILGLECAGSILDVAAGVTTFAAGDRVMALLAGGGYAEQVAVPAGCVMATPEAFSDTDAGAFPEVFATAYLNLFMLGKLGPGGAALVHGGSGGVGTAAIQLASEADVRILVTAGSSQRCRRCVELGAERAFDHHSDDFLAGCLEATADQGVDVVLDCIGAEYLESNLRALANDGRLVLIGLMGGRRSEIDLARVLSRRLQVIGSTLRGLSTEAKTVILESLTRRFGDAMSQGRVRPIVNAALTFDRAADAHRLLARGEVFGKIVLTPR